MLHNQTHAAPFKGLQRKKSATLDLGIVMITSTPDQRYY